MNFGISDISYMFAERTANSQANVIRGYFYGFKLANILSDIRLLLSPWIASITLQLEFADLGKGSLSLFNNFKFHTGMANSNEHLKDGAKYVLSSTHPSEKGKSQSKLEKDEKSFGYSKNVRMFAAFNTTRTNCIIGKNFLFPNISYQKNKTVGLPDAFLPMCNYVRVVTNGRLDSLSVFNNFKFIIK